MRNKLTVALAGGALATGAFVGQASAQQFPADTGNFNYNYVEGGVAFIDRDDEDRVGPVVRGSTAFHPNVFANAELSYLTDDVDITTFRAGPGARMAVTPAFDAYGMLRVAYQDVDNASSVDDTGYDVTVGFRSDVAPAFEVGGEIRYTDIDDFDDSTDFILRGLYEMTPQAELLGELHALEDADDDVFGDFGALVGARYNF